MSKVDSLGVRAGRKIARHARMLWSQALACLAPDRSVDFYLDRPFVVCLPFRSKEQFGTQLAGVGHLKQLEPHFGRADLLFVTVAGCPADDGIAAAISGRGGTLTVVPDFRSLVSFLAGAQFRVVSAPEAANEAESLQQWCDAFHVTYCLSTQKLAESLTMRGPLKLSGPFHATYAVHKGLWLSVMGNQYAFAEPLDWNIVRKLPGKFLELRSSAVVHAYPISLLSGPLNRITRQRAVGKLYAEYLQGESVVDIGCDVGGLQEFVGPGTRYVGTDMHGRPDIVLNLDQQRLPFEARSIDTIVCIETLEHLERIHQVLDNILTVKPQIRHRQPAHRDRFQPQQACRSAGRTPVFSNARRAGIRSTPVDWQHFRQPRSDLLSKRSQWIPDPTY